VLSCLRAVMRPRGRPVERELASIADGQHGVVTRAQLLRAGVTPAEIAHRVRTGALLRQHRGVYRVGHRAPSMEARYLAAVLACGNGAVLSGRAAAHLFGLLKGRPPRAEVTTRTERRVPRVVTRRERGAEGRDAIAWCGIPVTTVATTLVDIAAVLDVDTLARACHEAGARHGTTPAHVDAVLARRSNTKGAAKLRRILHGYHRSPHAWELDRRREREARRRGDEFRRYTRDDVFEDPRTVLAELRPLLSSCPA
jgi:predicted transcriptional regulator of viral defense system